MPGSSNENKHVVGEWLEQIDPAVVVDIGAGSGKYARRFKKPGQYWTAIEIWAPYVEQYKLEQAYDQVIVGDALFIIPGIYNSDCVIAGDVLEHMSKNSAIILASIILERAWNLIVSVPIVHYPQGAVGGNPYERHVKDDWSHAEVMDTWGDRVHKHVCGDVLGYYWLRGE